MSPVISWLAKNRAKCWSEPADVTQTNTKKNMTETSGTMRRYFKTTSERLPAHTDSECTFKSFTHFSSEKYFPRQLLNSTHSYIYHLAKQSTFQWLIIITQGGLGHTLVWGPILTIK